MKEIHEALVLLLGVAALLGLLSFCGCAAPSDEGVMFVSESGFAVTRGDSPADEGCGRLGWQWEQAAYISPDARVTTPSGLTTIGPVDPDVIDRTADLVEECLAGVGEPSSAARCGYPRREWALERECTTVLGALGEPAVTDPSRYVLVNAEALGSCDTWGKPEAPAECRWTVATQDAGRTVVVPSRAPEQAAEAFVRLATGCLYPWLDPALARCSAGL